MHPTFLKQNHVTAKLKAVLTQSVCYTKPVSITLMHWDTKWEEMFERKRYENYSLEKVPRMSSASHPSLTPPPLPAMAPPVTCVSLRITLPALGQLSHHTHTRQCQQFTQSNAFRPTPFVDEHSPADIWLYRLRCYDKQARSHTHQTKRK